MNDDFLTRDWADTHHQSSATIDKLAHRALAAIRETFDELHDIHFDAPWQRPTTCTPHATRSR